jgi:hypothetical protein
MPLSSLLLLSPIAAQNTWHVSGGANALDQAIAAAAPGDVLVVATGVYFPFQLTKGLTIHAPAGATLQGQYPSTPNDVTVTIPAGQEARISGFHFMADAQGKLTFPIPIPADPALRYLSLWFHGIGGSSLPLQAAVPVGGVVR